MNNYLKKILYRFENMAHPASGWLRSTSSIPKKASQQTEQNGKRQPSPDSYNVRGYDSKKNDNPRFTPAP